MMRNHSHLGQVVGDQETVHVHMENGRDSNNQSNSVKSGGKPDKNSERFKYQKRTGTTGGYKGHTYEINLFILGKLRGERESNKYYLATNVSGLGAFDDVVMRYWHKDDDEGESTTILLQSKHIDSKHSTIAIENFENPKNDKYYLGNYFLSYLDCKRKIEKSEKPLFDANSNLDVKLIIHTNASLEKNFNQSRIIDAGPNILSTESKKNEQKNFKFRLDNDSNSGIISMLADLSRRSKTKLLAKILVQYFCGEMKQDFLMNNKFFLKYHVFLSQFVFDIIRKIEIDERNCEYRICTIRQNFLKVRDSEPLEKNFIEEILHEFAKHSVFKKNSHLELHDENDQNGLVQQLAALLVSPQGLGEDLILRLAGNLIVCDPREKRLMFNAKRRVESREMSRVIENLENKFPNLLNYRFNIPYEVIANILMKQITAQTLKVPTTFGNIDPPLKKPDHLIQKLIELFEKYTSQKTIVIDDQIVGHEKVLTQGDLKNIGKLVGYILETDQNKKNLRFMKEEILSEGALELIKDLKSKAEQQGIEIDDYRFDIRISFFPVDSLITDHEDDINVREFLNSLEICTNQANCEELRLIVTDEMKNFYGLTPNEAEDSYLKVKDKATELWKHGTYYSEKNDDFFSSIVKFDIKFDVKSPVKLFAERTRELTRLHQMLQRSSEDETTTSRIIVVSGLGAIGKTELVKRYVQENDHSYDKNVLWINAESSATLTDSFTRLAKDKLGITTKDANKEDKDIKCVVKEVYEFFKRRKSLFVFNRAENVGTLKDFMPLYSSSSLSPELYVLITSREQEWERNIEVMELAELEPSDARALIIKGLGGSQEDKFMRSKAENLAEELQQFPLAIQQAIAYIQQQRITGVFEIDDYLEEYRNNSKKLLQSDVFRGIDNDYEKTTFTTWIVTFEKIRNEEHGELATRILALASYFAPVDIHRDMFSNLDDCDQRELKLAVRLLVKYSMVTGRENQSVFRIHKLVQKVTRINLEDREEEVLDEALTLFGKIDRARFQHSETCFNSLYHMMHAYGYANNYEKLLTKHKTLPGLLRIGMLSLLLSNRELYFELLLMMERHFRLVGSELKRISVLHDTFSLFSNLLRLRWNNFGG